MATFDEERELEEVEKIREQVLQAREERRRAEAAFEAFTSGFRTAPLQNPSEAVSVALPPANDPPEIHSDNLAVEPPAVPDAPEMVSATSGTIVNPTRLPRANGPALVFAGVALAGAAIFAVRWGQPNAEVATPDETPTTAASTPQRPVGPPVPVPNPPLPVAPPPAPAPVATSGVNVELTTRRRVWMRVTLDGQKSFEREVPADQHIPLHAARSILIRAGDAGAVFVRQNGRDAGPLGMAGVVATREFKTDATSRH
jgi:uncharacterized protein DUF4115